MRPFCTCSRCPGERPAETAACHFGTTAYEPPEILACAVAKDATGAATAWTNAAVDVWALGVVVFVALVGAHPFDPGPRKQGRGDGPSTPESKERSMVSEEASTLRETVEERRSPPSYESGEPLQLETPSF